jgi:ribokinase
MTSGKILVVGSSNTDMVIKMEKLPSPGETKLGGTFFMNSGGKGANQAVAVARMGGNLTFVTKVGKDIFGSKALDGFKKEYINTRYVFIDEDTPSGVALIMVEEEGENCIAVAPGANAKLSTSDIKMVENIFEAEIILMQLEIPMETIKDIVKIAKSNNQKVILNPAPAQKLDDELLNGLFIITPNETEASLLTGITVKDEVTASQAATVLLSKGVQNVIITMGPVGAYVRSGTISKIVPVEPVKAIDSTAAGDVFNGALAVAISEGIPIENAVAFANKAAAISVTRIGAQASIPFRNEILN